MVGFWWGYGTSVVSGVLSVSSWCDSSAVRWCCVEVSNLSSPVATAIVSPLSVSGFEVN